MTNSALFIEKKKKTTFLIFIYQESLREWCRTSVTSEGEAGGEKEQKCGLGAGLEKTREPRGRMRAVGEVAGYLLRNFKVRAVTYII